MYIQTLVLTTSSTRLVSMHMHKYVEDKLISDFQTFDGEIPIRDGHFIIVIGA
jgi:hypothetical protein